VTRRLMPDHVKLVLSAGEYLHERYHGRLYAKAQNLRGGLRAKYDAVLQKFDALVMPSTPMKAHRREDARRMRC
jgi:amidase